MATAKKTTKKKSTTSKKDLEAKIADLEAKLNKLAAAQEAKPAEAAPKPAETKPAETAKPKPAETAPEPKPAETAKPKPAETAPKPAEKAPPASTELHERFREIPTGNWNTQKVAITGFTAPGNRYFGSRALVAQVEVSPSNWNDHKTKITGYTAPGNKYFATKQRLAYHPEAKKFGTWIKDTPAPQAEKPKPAEAKKAEAGGPHGHDEKPAEAKKAEAKPKKVDAKGADWKSQEAQDAYAAKMKAKGATLPKGFIKDAKANTGH
ncbi:hypothetical protein OAI67_02280 [Candidatus Nitrosopelagicus sp.]|jgi:hypothetical protein|nr:hypothetical protein [Candidatus Nitrosopelagicus sp.]